MTIRTTVVENFVRRCAIVLATSFAWLSICGAGAEAQRTLGLDVSYWQGEIIQGSLTAPNGPTGWYATSSTGNRKFVMVRSSRGGTTGLDQGQGTPGGGSISTLSRRYDDPRFVQNMVRANNAGLFTSPYHFARPDVAGNTGADEAEHFIQAAGAWMRPGYMLPMFDLEAGQSLGGEALAEFSLDFSNEIYAQKGIRPSIYINGSYSSTLQSASVSLRNQLAQPAANTPSVVGPAFPLLVNARYPAGSGSPYAGDIQNENPKLTSSSFYGPWDDYGNSQPWGIWQYSSGEAIPGLSDQNVDGDIAQGDLEYVKDMLVPAVWMNDLSSDWGTLLNWNSGQPVVAPIIPEDQADPLSPTGPLPVARLPGAAGSGPTAGSNDTVILERPNANVTVTLSAGTNSNIRKLYVRETLNITGGTLTINYDPNYSNDFDNNPSTTFPNALRSGPISAQFSGAVTLSGTGSLSVNTLQVDASRTFTLAGSTGTLTFKQINLLSSAKIAVTGDVNISPLSNATATISGGSGNVDLSGGTRIFNIGNGSSDVDLDVVSPIINGGLTKNGAGTMRLSGSNTFAGAVTVNAGVLRSNNAAGFTNNTVITVNNGGTLDMSGITDTVASLGGASGGVITQGAAGLTLGATSGSNTFAGAITGSGQFTKNAGATQILNGNNSLGPVALNGGSLLFHGSNTTGAVTVSGGTLGGTGSISGTVTVNSTGHLAPGASIESLGMGALTLNTGSVLDMELGAPGVSDLITISGALTLNGGSVNLVNLGGLNAGEYTLASYTSKVGNVAVLGTPSGPSNFNYKLTASNNFLGLLVSIPGDFDLDGVVNAKDYVVWRKTGGTSGEYDVWRANFGRAAGMGSGAGLGELASVPEPATALLIVCGVLAFVGHRFRRG